MHILLAVLLMGHGAAHLPGFVAAWRLAVLREMPHHTTLLAGAVEVGEAGIRLVGTGWLLTALAFLVAALGAVAGRAGWVPLALGAVAVSTVLCVLEWPAARIGVAVNLALLAGLGLSLRAGWLPMPAPTP